MGKTGVLGAFEELVLLAVLHQGSNAYAVPVRRKLERRTGADVAMGSVYATLDRLEGKALIESHTDPSPSGGGRARRYYRVTADGVEALAASRRIRASMWDGIELPNPSGG
jgi:PadR family transcriptional regulator PadR